MMTLRRVRKGVKMAVDELELEEKLNIRTFGHDGSQQDDDHFGYEPTSYDVLERIVQSGLVKKENTVVDYGCGKGRVDFYFSHVTGCHTIGVEYDKMLYDMAMQNYHSAGEPENVCFVNTDAAEFKLPPEVDTIFLFNPFSVKILHSVMARIKEVYYEYGHEITIISYYSSDDYIFYFMTIEELLFDDEIDCLDLFHKKDKREMIVIFKFPEITTNI